MLDKALKIDRKKQIHQFEMFEPTDKIKEINTELEKDPKNITILMKKATEQVAGWDYQGAIDTYSKAIAIDPFKAILYRWRGHRLINVRMIAEGVADLELSSRLDPTNWETWYHLGLGQFLMGDHERAQYTYAECKRYAPTTEDCIAVAAWTWRNFMRLGKRKDAEKAISFIKKDMATGENFAYHRCLLMYKGILSPDNVFSYENPSDIDKVTIGFGLGNYFYVNGDKEKARSSWEEVVKEAYWPAFGFIAAETALR
jgi:tetratricopeptide (TPR) repeat protein